MSHKVVPPKYYVVNFSLLTMLMIATVVAAKWDVVDLGRNPNGVNLAVAILIAIAKATCIVSIFMGVAFSSPLVRTFAIGGFSWLLILFLFFLTDYVNPVEEFGTPYYDADRIGESPLPGGQNYITHGSERAKVHDPDYHYVNPGHHGDDHAPAEDHGEEETHEAPPDDSGGGEH